MSDVPDLRNATHIGVDTETKDPYLKECGPGWGRGIGNVVGISLAAIEGSKINAYYLPIRHAHTVTQNLPEAAVIAYVSDQLSTDAIKLGANCIYDYGWLMHHGVKTKGKWYDVQFAQALIQPWLKSFSLEACATACKVLGKQSNELYTWAAQHYNGQATAKDQGGNIWRCPPSVVSDYACYDAGILLNIWQQQGPNLLKLGLYDLFELECKLIPILVKMRMRGMCIDELAAYDAKEELTDIARYQYDELKLLAGFDVNVNSSADLARFFTKMKIPFPLTEKGNPSFTAEWLAEQSRKEATLVNNIRKVNKAQSTFINSAILTKAVNGRLYPSLHPLRGDKGGTVTGRFSCSNPNAQQIPSRDDFLAPIIRGIFVPEKGYTHWCKLDYSQIEYRMFAHFSKDEALIRAYQDPNADFHDLVGQMLGAGIPRKYVKCINFAKLYGAGNKKIAAMLKALGGEIDTDSFLKNYDTAFPAAQDLMIRFANEAKQTYRVTTLLNRYTRFDKMSSSFDGEVQHAYKAINYVLQGSAADFMKKGIVDAEEAGLFERIGYPHTLVHDEIALSYHPDLRNDFIQLKEIMQNAITLRVPMIMDVELGPNWGDVKDFNLYTGEFV